MIFEQYLDYTNALKELLKEPFFQWIDGSFVTKKKNSNDIDFVTFIDHKTFQSKIKEIDIFRKLRFQPRRLFRGGITRNTQRVF